MREYLWNGGLSIRRKNLNRKGTIPFNFSFIPFIINVLIN